VSCGSNRIRHPDQTCNDAWWQKKEKADSPHRQGRFVFLGYFGRPCEATHSLPNYVCLRDWGGCVVVVN
jgi:hypothetical protein